MIRTRPLKYTDVEKIKEIHERCYPHLAFPNLVDMLNAFVIEDENREIVMAGGVESIAEAYLVTDTSKSRIKIGKALVVAQGACLYTCQEFGIKELFALTDNNDYARHLIQHGFEDREHRVLSMRIPDGQKEDTST